MKRILKRSCPRVEATVVVGKTRIIATKNEDLLYALKVIVWFVQECCHIAVPGPKCYARGSAKVPHGVGRSLARCFLILSSYRIYLVLRNGGTHNNAGFSFARVRTQVSSRNLFANGNAASSGFLEVLR